MTGRLSLTLVVAVLLALALVPAGTARAQADVEFSPTLVAVGDVTLSFDLPEGYTVTEQSVVSARAEGPMTTYPSPDPVTLWLGSRSFWAPLAVKEAAYEALADLEMLGEPTVIAEGPLTVGQLEGYTLRVREYVVVGDYKPDTYSTKLVVVVRVAGEADPLLYPAPSPGGSGYVWMYASGEIEHFEGHGDVLLETGESVAQWTQRAFDAILGSLAASLPTPVTPTPEATPIAPTPEATPTPEVTPVPEATPTPEATLAPTLQPGATPAAPAQAQAPHIELSPTLEAVGQVFLAFDVPPDYTVSSQSEDTAHVEGPVATYPLPGPAWLTVWSETLWSRATPRELAYQNAADGMAEASDWEVLAEGPLSLGQFEGYTLRVRAYFGPEVYGTGLFVVVRIATDDERLRYPPPEPGGNGYVRLVAGGGHEHDYSGEVFLESGESLAQWHQRAFDAIVASLAISVRPVEEPSQPEFVRAVPAPDEISSDPEVIGSNIFLTLLVILAFAFTSTLFNKTLDENRPEIEGWARRLLAPFRRLSGPVQQQYGALAQGLPWLQRLAGPAVILALTGLLYGFLSPDFGFNTRSVVLFASLVVGVGGVTYVYEGGQALFTRRRFRLGAGVRVYAVALVIGAGCVLLSRLVGFQPGFLYGFVASYALLAPAALDRRQSGQVVFFPAVTLLALSVIAWLLVIPLREVTHGSDAWWVALPEGVAVAVFVTGLEGLFFCMIPLTFMDGAKVAAWNRLLWFLMFGAAGFLFWHVLLNQEGAYLDALPERRVIAALSLLALYSVITLGTWAYFRGRVHGWAVPPTLWRRGPR